tara:strand:+ start:807 stop:971 length:165 start_codon:yes stop_codon:yes gene_type:complete
MKISELIKQLEELKDEQGDSIVSVEIGDDKEWEVICTYPSHRKIDGVRVVNLGI